MTLSQKSLSRYRAFHGRNPRKIRHLRTPDTSEFIFLANPEILTYASDKFNGGGDGRKAFYSHRFGAKAKIFCNPSGTVLFITGIKVTARGIQG